MSADVVIVIVTGGRRFGARIEERERLHDALTALDPTCVGHGCAPGADTLASGWVRFRRYWRRTDVREMGFRADWDMLSLCRGHKHSRYGAGPCRNGRMVAWGKAQAEAGAKVFVLACPGGKGTADCVDQARAAGLTVKTLDEVLGAS